MRRIPDYPFPEHDTMDPPTPNSVIPAIIAEIICFFFIGWMLYAAIGVARDYSFDEVASRQETDLGSSYRTANGGQP